MMPNHFFTQSFDKLPNVLPIFPLAGAVVLPGGTLPLNIFEPRYLAMVQDAMRSNQLIGVIQPKDNLSQPSLYKIGCAARIRRYEELDDGRLEIELNGLCRFNILEELESMRDYRIIKADWMPYEHDMKNSIHSTASNHPSLVSVLKRYFESKNLDTDWDIVNKIDQAQLVNNLLSYLPLTPEDKQLLVEANGTSERIKFFIAILQREQSNGNNTRH